VDELGHEARYFAFHDRAVSSDHVLVLGLGDVELRNDCRRRQCVNSLRHDERSIAEAIRATVLREPNFLFFRYTLLKKSALCYHHLSMVQDVCFKELKRADGSHEIATDVISGISRRKEATDSRHRPQKTRTRFDDEEGNSTRVHQQTLFILSSE